MNPSFINLIKNKSFSMRAEGTSMLPILQQGDKIYYKKTSFKQSNVNDIIIIKKQRQLLTHRIIYKSKSYLITKGDNNPESDGKIPSTQIIGKAYQIKRNKVIINPNDIYLMQSTLYFKEIIIIKRLFDKDHIDFVFLKGLPLHFYYEKTHPKRIYADCDILIDKTQFKAVDSALASIGYRQYSQSLSKIHNILRQKTVEITYYKIINRFPVTFDVHLEIDWMSPQLGRLEALYPQKLIDKLTSEFIKGKRKIVIHGSSLYILSSIHLVIYLALHFFHHNYRGAFRLDFLDRIIRKSKLSSDSINQLIESVKTYRLHNFVYPAFVLLKTYYQTPIPQDFLTKIKPTNPLIHESVNSLIKINIFDDEPRISAGINRFKTIFLLSPYPFWRKLFIFGNPQVIYSILWIISRRVSLSFKR